MFMRPDTRVSRLAVVAAAGIVLAAIPALSQDRPESILPPGFGDAPEAPAPRRQEQETARPRSDADARSVVTPSSANAPSSATTANPASTTALALPEESKDEEATDTPVLLVDIPAQVRRSTDVVGLLGRNILVLNGANGQQIVIDMDNSRIVVICAVKAHRHHSYKLGY